MLSPIISALTRANALSTRLVAEGHTMVLEAADLVCHSGFAWIAGERAHVVLPSSIAVRIDPRRYRVELDPRHARRLVVERVGPGAFEVRALTSRRMPLRFRYRLSGPPRRLLELTAR